MNTDLRQSWSIIIICFNEEKSIGGLIEDTQKVLKKLSNGINEIIVVDDGSRDRSLAISKTLAEKYDNIKIITHPSNRGIGHALRAGYEAARNENVCAIPGDAQFDVEELLPHVVVPPRTVVSFCRKIKPSYTFYRNFISWFNKKLNQYFLNMKLADVNWVKIYKNEDLKKLKLRLTSLIVESEICWRLIRTDTRVVEVPSVYIPRKEGRSKILSKKILFQIIRDSFKLYSRYKPPVFILFSLPFFVLGSIGILHHEMWRDELQIWLVARDSAGFFEFLKNSGTEHHPLLWHLLNFWLSRFTRSPVAIQIVNWIIGTLNAFLILRYAPFARLNRVLLVFGYFFFYEYTIIARNYGLEFFFILLLGVFYKNGERNLLRISLLLFCLANTHLFGAILAFSFGLMLIFEYWQRPPVTPSPLVGEGRGEGVILPLLIFLVGIAAGFGHVAFQLFNSGDLAPILAELQRPKGLEGWLEKFSVFLYGFLPLPQISDIHFWNSHFLTELPPRLRLYGGFTLSAVLLLISLFILRRRPSLLLLYLMTLLPLMTINLFLWPFQMRHAGHFPLFFIFALWLLADTEGLKPFANRFLSLILSIQFLASAYAFAMDLKYPFSNAKNLGEYLAREEFKNHLVAGYIDYAVSPATAFSDRPIYFPQSRKSGTFIFWDKERKYSMSDGEILKEVFAFNGKEDQKRILVKNREDNPPRCAHVGDFVLTPSGHSLRCLAKFENAIQADENYYLYLME